MSQKGKTQLAFIIIVPPDHVAEGDRLFRSHASWMEPTHHRDGDKALLSYNVSKGPELSNPFDPSSVPTGNTCFILSEVYEGPAGVADHFQQVASSWKDFPALGEWVKKCKITAVPSAQIVNSLW